MKIDPQRGYPPRSPPERVHCAARRSVTTQRIMDRDEPLSWLKVVVSRSGRWAVFAGPADPERRGRPARVVILPWRRHRLDPTTGIKSIGTAGSMLGLEEAERRGADDGLWLNDRGHAIGACTANLFVASGSALVTPALSNGARDGVTRVRAIEAARTSSRLRKNTL